MIALTVPQPWATLLVRGLVPLVNRQGGPREIKPGTHVAICADRTVDAGPWYNAATLAVFSAGSSGAHEVVSVVDHAVDYIGRPMPERMRRLAERAVPHGMVVGVAVLDEVRYRARDVDPWFLGPVGWYFRSAVEIQPVRCDVLSGEWRLPESVYEAVKLRYKESARRASAQGEGHDVG